MASIITSQTNFYPYVFSPFDIPIRSEPLLVQARWHQYEGEFVLRCQHGRLFFRPPNQTSVVLVVIPALPANLAREAWPDFWQEALAHDQVARFVTYTYLDSLVGDYAVAALWEHERVSGRQWWQEAWTPLPSVQRKTLHPLWHPKWHETSPKIWRDHLLQAPLPTQVRQHTQLRWLRGDEATWRRVVRARLLSLDLSTERTVSLYPNAHFWPAPSSNSSALALGEGWPELMHREFVLQGFVWHRRSEFAAEVRRGWHIERSTFAERVPSSDSFSFHERLEAQLFLRDWLSDTATPTEMKQLLS